MKAYTLQFSDGKSCTHIDPEGEPFEEVERTLRNIFSERLISVIQGLDAGSVSGNTSITAAGSSECTDSSG